MGWGSSRVSEPTPVPNGPRKAWTEPHDDPKWESIPHRETNKAPREGHSDMKLEETSTDFEILEYDNNNTIYERDDLVKPKSRKVAKSKAIKIEGDIKLIDYDIYGETTKSVDNHIKVTPKEKYEKFPENGVKEKSKKETASVDGEIGNNITDVNKRDAPSKRTTIAPSKKKLQTQEKSDNNAQKKGNNAIKKNKVILSNIPQPKWLHDYDLPAVDPTEGLGELPQIYKNFDRPIKIEDTFWKEKKKIISDFDTLRKIDKHAIEAPNTISGDIHKLVEYLIKPAENDLQKYRSIARWIGENISYDVEGYFDKSHSSMISDPLVALKKRRAVCAGYSGLFELMCKAADLPCDVIRGQAKGYGFVAGSDGYQRHAWNKIRIGNQSFLCDTTWGSGGIGPDQKFKKNWKEHHFLSDPSFFATAHLPLGPEGDVNQIDQLVEKPFSSLETWRDEVDKGFIAHVTGATPWNRESTIISEDNTGEIKVDIPQLVKVYVFLSRLPDRKKITASHATISWEGNTAVFRYALPGPGKYLFSARAGFLLTGDKECEDLFGELVSYCIHGKGKEKHPPNEIDDGFSLGNNPFGATLGYYCISHSKPVIETSERRIVMQFACPSWGRGMFKLQSSKLDSPSRQGQKSQRAKGLEEIEKCIYIDSYPGKEVCYIFLPRQGNYSLQHLIMREPGTNSYHRNAVFMIKSKFAGKSSRGPFRDYNDWGPRPLFSENDLGVVNLTGSTIRLRDGIGQLTLQRPLTSLGQILANVVDMEDKNLTSGSTVVTTENGPMDTELVHITINISTAGFYVINLFVNLQYAGRFMISSDGHST